jgi:hypothetical protein
MDMDATRRFGRARRGTGLAILATLVAVLSLAAPASAGIAPTTRFVDDDGTASATGCNGSQTAPTTIQAAVNASNDGDKIIVCPGDYIGRVRIEDFHRLTLRAAVPWTANVIAPLDFDRFALVEAVDSRNITVKWLNLLAQAEECVEATPNMIFFEDVFGASIRANHIGVIGTDSLGDCGYERGISVEQGGNLTIAYNRVTDFKDIGIKVDESPTAHIIDELGAASIRGNTVRYFHAAYGPDAGDDFAIGIWLVESEGIDVEGNWARSLPGAGDETPELNDGILVTISNFTPVRVVDNHILHTGSGLYLEGLAANTVVRDNRIHDTSIVGLNLFSGIGVIVMDNIVTGGEGDGITLGNPFFDPDSSSGNVIQDNNFRFHAGTDCVDYDDPTDSTWTNNLGDSQNQDNLCIATPI